MGRAASCLLSPSQGMDVDRNGTDIGVRQTLPPCGHHAKARFAHGGFERRAISTIKPDCVSKVRRPEVLISKSLIAVAGAALGRENLCPRTGKRCIELRLRQAENILYNRVDFCILQYLAKSRHHRVTCVWIRLIADTMGNGSGDAGDITAPKPIIIQQVGIAHSARGSGPVTLAALGQNTDAPRAAA